VLLQALTEAILATHASEWTGQSCSNLLNGLARLLELQVHILNGRHGPFIRVECDMTHQNCSNLMNELVQLLELHVQILKSAPYGCCI